MAIDDPPAFVASTALMAKSYTAVPPALLEIVNGTAPAAAVSCVGLILVINPRRAIEPPEQRRRLGDRHRLRVRLRPCARVDRLSDGQRLAQRLQRQRLAPGVVVAAVRRHEHAAAIGHRVRRRRGIAARGDSAVGPAGARAAHGRALERVRAVVLVVVAARREESAAYPQHERAKPQHPHRSHRLYSKPRSPAAHDHDPALVRVERRDHAHPQEGLEGGLILVQDRVRPQAGGRQRGDPADDEHPHRRVGVKALLLARLEEVAAIGDRQGRHRHGALGCADHRAVGGGVRTLAVGGRRQPGAHRDPHHREADAAADDPGAGAIERGDVPGAGPGDHHRQAVDLRGAGGDLQLGAGGLVAVLAGLDDVLAGGHEEGVAEGRVADRRAVEQDGGAVDGHGHAQRADLLHRLGEHLLGAAQIVGLHVAGVLHDVAEVVGGVAVLAQADLAVGEVLGQARGLVDGPGGEEGDVRLGELALVEEPRALRQQLARAAPPPPRLPSEASGAPPAPAALRGQAGRERGRRAVDAAATSRSTREIVRYGRTAAS